MAQEDLRVFLQERARAFDDDLDVSPGSPFDTQVIQPVLRRLGKDPLTVDFFTFARSRLLQEFPDMATQEGDAVTDLLLKPAALLWDPILREIQRIRNSQSFRDAAILTVDEADALGANLVTERARGNTARGVVRLYFTQPQSVSVGPTNFVTSKTGLHFFPSEIQSILVGEMLLNVEGSFYYFDINVVAEAAGEQYNVASDQLVTIANLPSVVRIINKRRFRFGAPEENAVQYLDRAKQELSERSLVTLRGISAKIARNFPEVTRLAIVGFNDPEMQRDVVSGGGLGPVAASGLGAVAVTDGISVDVTSRLDLSLDGVDLTAIIGPLGTSAAGWVLTLVDGFLTAPALRDLTVSRILSPTVLEVEERVIAPVFLAPKYWMLRKKEITLSGIPGGILFPDGPNGTVSIRPDEIHIGGATDVFVRGTDLQQDTLSISAVTDDVPLLSGLSLTVVDALGNVSLGDIVLGTDYAVGDSTYDALVDAKTKQYSLVITENVGGSAGVYRVVDVVQVNAAAPILQLDPAPPLVVATLRWKLLDRLDVDLVAPKETRIAASDLLTIQNVDIVEAPSSVDFDDLGVATDDTLEILTGPDAGLYQVVEVVGPFFNRIRVDRTLAFSTTGVQYRIYRPNTGGGINRPLVRVTSVELLDTTGQPVGSQIPYARPVDARTGSFSNFGQGIRSSTQLGRLGITSPPIASGADVSGDTLNLWWDGGAGTATVNFTGSNPVPLASIVTQINNAVGRVVASVIADTRLGIAPINGYTVAFGTALPDLFDLTDQDAVTSRDVRADDVVWSTLVPQVRSDVDAINVLDGAQVGFYGEPSTEAPGLPTALYTGLSVGYDFFPEAGRQLQVGYRSTGTARVYFMDPTSVEFSSENTVFTVEGTSGPLTFVPDPNNRHQRIPALPAATQPKDGEVLATVDGTALQSATTDFIKKGVLPGDVLALLTQPLQGTLPLADPIPLLALKTLVISLDGGPDKTITFVNDSTNIPSTSMTRAGMVSQINRVAGRTICQLFASGGQQYLEFETVSTVVIRATGTANPILGFSTVVDVNNDSPARGEYDIEVVRPNYVVAAISGTHLRQMFKVYRNGIQRISSTEMAENMEAPGLYYVDVQLVSAGTGDNWNVPSGQRAAVDGYEADGYYLTTGNTTTSFSPVEDIRMVLSRSVLEQGVDDDPENATQVSGQNILVNYEWSPTVANVNNYLLAETERTTNSSPLSRHLIPHFVRMDVNYTGGRKAEDVSDVVFDYVKLLLPQEQLESSDVEHLLYEQGASYVENPVTLIAVVHNQDRSITVERSQDKLNTGRLAAFIPDQLTFTRRLGG